MGRLLGLFGIAMVVGGGAALTPLLVAVGGALGGATLVSALGVWRSVRSSRHGGHGEPAPGGVR